MRLVLIVGALAAAGCGGGPKTAKVSGKVRFQGQPIALGQISFIAEDGRLAAAPIDNGAYTAPQAPVGLVKITVTSFPPGPKVVPADQATAVPNEPVGGAFVPIPARYAHAEESKLSYTVTDGAQEHDIDLTP